jgi:hypothetical protein
MVMERGLRRIVLLLGQIMAACLEILSVLAAMVVWFGLLLFVLYDQFCTPDPSAESGGCIKSDWFPNVAGAIVSSFTCLTTENYPDVMIDAYVENRLFAIPYVLFLAIAEFFMLRVILAKVYIVYKGQLQQEAEMVDDFRVESLDRAFDIMTQTDGSFGKLRMGEMTELLIVFTRWSEGLHRLDIDIDLGEYVLNKDLLEMAFGEIDEDKDGDISKPEFRRLCSVLPHVHDAYVAKVGETQVKAKPATPSPSGSSALSPERRTMLEALVTSRRFERGVQLVLLLNTFTVMAELKFEYAPDRVDAQYAFSGWEVVELTFCLVYAVEMAVKMILVGPAAYCSTWRNRLDGSLTVLSLVGELTVVALGTRYSVLRVVIFARLLRLLRIFVDVDEFSLYFQQLFSMLPALRRLALTLFLIMFAYSVVGVAMFGGKISIDNLQYADSPADKAGNGGDQGQAFEAAHYWSNNFNDVLMGIVTLWTVLIGNNWNTTAGGFVTVTSEWAWFYFIAYYTTVTLIVFNTFVAYGGHLPQCCFVFRMG